MSSPWSRLRSWLGDYLLEAELWCEGRSPWARLVLLAYLAYAGVRHLASDQYRSWFSGITLAFHEMGHLLLSWFGQTLHMLGGSLMQLVVPLAAALYLLLRQRDHFGLAVGAAWLSFSMWELAVYVADASREQLPLVGYSDNPIHDWAWLLTRWHLLNQDYLIAAVVRVCATVTWLGAMLLGAWLCWHMLRPQLRGSG